MHRDISLHSSFETSELENNDFLDFNGFDGGEGGVD